MPAYDEPPEDRTRAVTEGFATRFGGPPAIVGRAPGRVNLIGEHTDYNNGLCLPMALPHATFAAVRPATDGVSRVASTHTDDDWSGSLDDVDRGSVPGWAAYPVGVLWALRSAGWRVPDLQIMVDSTVPVGAGLSSSAALECSVGIAVAELLGRDLDPAGRRVIVEAAIRAEAEMAGAPTGGLDQTVSMLAVADHALLIDFGDGSTRPVPMGLPRAGLSMMIVDTRVSHALNDGGYRRRVDECRQAAAALGVPTLRDARIDDLDRITDPLPRRRARHVLTENARVDRVVAALERDAWDEVGALMTESHRSLRDDYEVSSPELDLVVRTALDNGALGARMTGGGFGGSAIALVADAGLDRVADGCRSAFSTAGLTDPGIVLASAGAPASATVVD